MFRRALLPVAALLVAGQMATAIAGSSVLWRPGNAPGLADSCRCPQETATSCPMHKAATKTAPCAFRSAHPVDVAALTRMLGALGVLPSPAALVSPAPSVARALQTARAPLFVPLVPDPPPPRA